MNRLIGFFLFSLIFFFSTPSYTEESNDPSLFERLKQYNPFADSSPNEINVEEEQEVPIHEEVIEDKEVPTQEEVITKNTALPFTSPKKRQPSCPNYKCLKSLGIFALADQINQSMIDSGLSDTKRFISTSDQCFPYYHAPLGMNLWMESFLFHAKSRERKNAFTMTTFGVQGQGEWTLFHFFTLGGGLRYYHSSFDQNLEMNGISFGPSLSVSFGKGSVSFSTFWSYNDYVGKISLCGKKRGVDHHSWDRTFRFEGGWNFPLPESFLGGCSLAPFGKVDFLNVSESSYKISSYGEVKEHESNFCNFDLGTKLTKTLYCTKTFILLPSLIFGMHSIHPYGVEKFVVSAKDGKRKTYFNPESTMQFLFEGEVLALINQGIVVGIHYESRNGGKYPLKGGKIRVEWNF